MSLQKYPWFQRYLDTVGYEKQTRTKRSAAASPECKDALRRARTHLFDNTDQIMAAMERFEAELSAILGDFHSDYFESVILGGAWTAECVASADDGVDATRGQA